MKSALIVGLLAVATPLAAGTAPTASLAVPFATILPGVPWEAAVEYRNPTDHRVAAGAVGTMTIQAEGGTPYTFRVTVDHGSDSTNVDLEPGEEQTGSINWNENLFFQDAPVARPGTYLITLDLVANPDLANDGTTVVEHLRTAPVRLTRVMPTGDDAELWQRMQDAAGGTWPSHGFGSRATPDNAVEREILTKYQNSAYYPYALLLGRKTAKDDVHVAMAAAARFADSPAYPRLLLAVANDECDEAVRAEQRHRAPAEIEAHYKQARFYYQQVQQTGYAPLRANAITFQRSVEADLDHVRAAKREN